MSTRYEVEETLDNATIDPALTWTTGNVAEAFPGVFTTLGFTFIHEPMELAFRKMFVSLGVFSPKEIYVPDRVEDMFWTLFAGRAAANIDKFRTIANVTPGTSATAVEQQLFGYVRPETIDANTTRRYPVILAKAPQAVVRLPKQHDAEFAELRRWRLEQLETIGYLDHAGCAALLDDARSRFESIMIKHLVVAFVSSGLADRLAAKLAELGLPGLEAKLLSGVGSDENEVAHDLWALAHDEITLREFSDRHGYHGTNEGQLSGVSWREDPTPVLARRTDYRAIAADSPRAPRNRSAEQEQTRLRALAELESSVPQRKRVGLGLVVRLAARWLALREQGKAGYLLTFDVARAAMRRHGALLVAQNVIDQVDDVFHLSYDELQRGASDDRHADVERRRAEYDERTSYRLPQAWTGLPTLAKAGESSAPSVDGVVTGVAASGGIVEGRARVVRDPSTTELDDGDILVCETTDPSWVSLFLVAGGVVTDHGGMLSHGPIVARELGIPCVCGTENGSYRIVDGQRIRLDGNTGTVTVLSTNPNRSV
ncbi:PEP-utilizing enzyme [Antrihabitans sp. YC2-6]|uniref:PEP-utilizing enzyme n=1 Tax=Antrihabitans sp. YC2-6 TaxID=2799498 RepID=UPI0018F5663B|nr:PEP-utilizing enzyme [Antrihabitans sp. YC2-6]MBJ8344411.1 phosphoenolpyruvate carboxykinase [Antrihabitans sp. YC2-6]